MDTVIQPPHVSRAPDQHLPVTRQEVEGIIDGKLQAFALQLSEKTANDTKRADMKQRAFTYGVGGVAGLAAGVGGTLLFQRLFRRRGGAPTP